MTLEEEIEKLNSELVELKKMYTELKEKFLAQKDWHGRYKEGFTRIELQKRLGINYNTLTKHMREGLLLSSSKAGKSSLFSRKDLLEWNNRRSEAHGNIIPEPELLHKLR